MLYRLIADLVVVIHLALIVFVGGGSLLTRRRPWLAWLHAPSLICDQHNDRYGVYAHIARKLLRRLAGEGAYEGSGGLLAQCLA